MQNKRKEDLCELIHSLSRVEKGYYSKRASAFTLREQKLYKVIFRAIDRMKVYDEDALLQSVKGLSKPNLSNIKNYLYHHILAELSHFHRHHSAESEIRQLLNEADMLYRKGLYGHCARLVPRARLLAKKHELRLLVLEAIRRERRLVEQFPPSDMVENTLRLLTEEESGAAGDILKLSALNDLNSRFSLILKQTGRPRTRADHHRYLAIIRSPVMRQSARSSSLSIRLSYYHIQYVYLLAVGRYREGYGCLLKLTELMESNPYLIRDRPRSYLSAVNNLIYCINRMGQYEALLPALRKIRELDINHPVFRSDSWRAMIFARSYAMELEAGIRQGAFLRGRDLVQPVMDGIKSHEGMIDPEHEFSLYYNIAYLHFGSGDYSAAQQWLNRLLNHEDIGRSPALHAMSRILYLICQFESGATDVLEYLLPATYRFLIRRHRLFQMETLILGFIRSRLLSRPGGVTLQESFRKLKNEMERVCRDPFEKQILDYFDFLSWLESKISGLPFAKVVKDKVISRQS